MKTVALLPEAQVELDGSLLAAEIGESLVGVRVQHRLGFPSQCEVRFQEVPGQEVVDVRPGATLKVSIEGFDDPLFDGEITGVEHHFAPYGTKQVWLRAYDLLHRLRKSQPVRAFKEATVSTVAEEIAAPLGLSVDAQQDGPTWPIIVQYRQSDLELLVDLGWRCGLYPVIVGSSLKLIDLEGFGDPIALDLGDSLFEIAAELNGDRGCREVQVTGWDTALTEVHGGSSSEPATGRDVSVDVPPGDVGSEGVLTFVDEVASTDSHAVGLAQAELTRRVNDEVTITGTAEGNPALIAGRPVHVKGVSDGLDGRYVLTHVTHRIDQAAGFVSDFGTAAPVERPRPRAAMVTVGTVVDIGDPQEIGRVRLRLPALGDIETDWVPVLSAGAGAGKGLIALPDVDDMVLAVSSHEDPARTYVIGGIYGASGPPDTGIVAGSVRRFTFVTPGLQRFVLDDDRQLVHIGNSGGSYLEMSPEKVRLHSAVDLEIDAPGRAIVIRAKTVDFQRAEEPEDPAEPDEPGEDETPEV